MELDLTQNDAPKELINKVTEQLGYPHILINNAAYSTNNDFSTLTAEELDKHYMVNVRATTLLSSQFSRDLIRNLVVELLILLRGNFKPYGRRTSLCDNEGSY